MSKQFAEKIIDSMVDENGYCGKRGLSPKQFLIISECLVEAERYYEGQWNGQYKTVEFWCRPYVGTIGKYNVEVEEHYRFGFGHNVVEISLRDKDEYEAELEEERKREEEKMEAERKRKEMMDFSNSDFIAQPKKRIDLTLTLVNDYEYEGTKFSYYDTARCHIYTFRDADGNCVIWKTKNAILHDWEDEDGHFHTTMAKVGDKVTMRATVKEHSEYRGTKQTVINRPTIKDIEKA